MSGTIYRVVNGRMVRRAGVWHGEAMDIEAHDHKHGNRSATRYTRAALTHAEHLGTLPQRLALRVGRKRPAA